MRVVSLLASGTEIICALGAGDWLVGRSHECDNPAWVRKLPACSEPAFDISVSSREIDTEVRRRLKWGEPLYRIHTDLIDSLHPDLVIAQAHCEVCAVTPGDVARGCVVEAKRVMALSAGSLEGIFDDTLRLGRALNLESRGREVIREERKRLERVRVRVAGRRKPTVALIEWTDPVFPMANWTPELVEIAGGRTLLGAPGQHSFAIDGEQIAASDPDFVIVAPCGFDFERTCRERTVLESHAWWNSMRAVREERVAFADGNRFFNRSGMTVAQTAEIIAEIVHDVTFDDRKQGVYWNWLHAIRPALVEHR